MSNGNEMEQYERNMAQGAGVALEPDPDEQEAFLDETEVHRASGGASSGGLTKKKKQLVTFGIGGALILLVVLFVSLRVGSSGSPPKEEFLAAVPQGSASADAAKNDKSTVLVPQGGSAPMVFGEEPKAPTAAPGSLQTNELPQGINTPPKPPEGFGPSSQASEAIPSANTAQPTVSAVPSGPALSVTQTPTSPPLSVVTTAQGKPAPAASATVSAQQATQLAEAQSRAVKSELKAKELESQVDALKRSLALLAEKEKTRVQAQQTTATTAAPPKPPVVAVKPQPPQSPAKAPVQITSTVAAKAPQVIAAPAVQSRPGPSTPMTVKAEDLKGVITKSGARASQGKIRSDFTVYAVTDGRVWVVDRDGERLGPLAIGSPLTDGSKITGIDVPRGAVITTAGEIQ